MNERFEELLRTADFSKESNLYEKLKNDMFNNSASEFLKRRRLSEDDLEMLSAAGSIQGYASLPTFTSEEDEGD